MLRPRIIPCLLIKNGGLVKTIQFDNPKYVGDPINAVRIFNEKIVDEIMIIDIDATVFRHEPDIGMIKNLAVECRMPLCYGGGIKTLDQIEKIISLGVEKIALSSAAIENPSLIVQAARNVGSQSIVIVLDIRKNTETNQHEIWTHNGKKYTGCLLKHYVKELESLGVGEIVLNSIDNDGLMNGCDCDMVAYVRDVVKIPITVLGGIGSIKDIGDLISRFGAIGIAAGSFFVFKGIHRAVLISYPSMEEKDSLVKEYYIPE